MALTLEYFHARIKKCEVTGCWLWTAGKSPRGYGYMADGNKGRHLAHRFSYENFVEAVPNWGNLQCCHKCDNPPCVNPEHLFKGTRSQNMRDCGSKGRHWTQQPENNHKVSHIIREAHKGLLSAIDGTKNRRSKLTIQDLASISALLEADRMTHQEIGLRHGVSKDVIANISRGKSYTREIRALKRSGK